MAISINDNYNLSAGKPFDDRYLNISTPWVDKEEVLTAITTYRYVGLTVNIDGDEYWWKDGLTDGDLVLKVLGDIGTITGTTNGLSLFNGDRSIGLGGVLSNDVTICGNYGINLGSVDSGLTSICGVTPIFNVGDFENCSHINLTHDENNSHFDVSLSSSVSNSCANIILGSDGCFEILSKPNGLCCSGIISMVSNSDVPSYKVYSKNNNLEFIDETYISQNKSDSTKLIRDKSNINLNVGTKLDYVGRNFNFFCNNDIIFSILSGGTARYVSSVSIGDDYDLTYKKYVDDEIDDKINVIGGLNGLSRLNDNIELGGDLYKNTIISGNTSGSLGFIQINDNDSSLIKFNNDNLINIKSFRDETLGVAATSYGTGIEINTDSLKLINDYGVGLLSLELSNSSMVVTDSINSRGLVYASDYEDNFTDNSLVTKKYVTGITSNLIGAFTTANNGLSASNQIIGLGGTLTGDTYIDGDSDNNIFDFSNLAGFRVSSVNTTVNGSSSLTITSPSIVLNNGGNNVIDISYACNLITDNDNGEGFVYYGNYSAVGGLNPR